MRLFHRSDCPFCWKVRLVLAETGLAHELAPAHQAGDLNPQRTIPVLQDGNLVIWDSAVIAEYLVERAPTCGLMPNDPEDRARIRLLHTYSDRIAGQGLREVIFEKRSKPVDEWDLARIERGIQGWEACLEWISGALGSNPYMAGNTVTLADFAFLPRFHLADRFKLPLGPRHRNLTEWLERMRARPSFSLTCPSL